MNAKKSTRALICGGDLVDEGLIFRPDGGPVLAVGVVLPWEDAFELGGFLKTAYTRYMVHLSCALCKAET